MNPIPPRPPVRPSDGAIAVFMTAVLAIVTLWSFWPTLGQLAERWSIDPQYSHGFLVPLFAALILWLRRPTELTWTPNPWGAAILFVALVPRWLAATYNFSHVDGACMILALLGATLLVGGWDVFRWAWPAIVFLGFMVPLPDFIETGISVPLRRLATVVSAYVLQTFGYPAIADGNVIQIEQIRLNVIEACSGLGMLMTFLALAAAMALLISAPTADRVILFVSAIPIAVLANALRITFTAMIVSAQGSLDHFDVIHSTLGWLMMPLALGLLWVEWKYLRLLLVSTGDEAPMEVPLSPWLERVTPSRTRWS